MGIDLETLNVKWTARFENIEQGLKRLEEKGKKTDSTFKTVGDTVKGMFSAYAIKRVIDFGAKMFNAGEQARKEMARVKNTVENAGFAWEKLGPKIDAYSQKMVKLGFDDEETAQSVASLLAITRDYGTTLTLNGLAMDFARDRGIGLEEATRTIASITAGNTRILKQYGIEVRESASAQEVLAVLMERVKGTAEKTKSPVEELNVNLGNLQETIGEKMAPAVNWFVEGLNDMLQNGLGGFFRQIWINWLYSLKLVWFKVKEFLVAKMEEFVDLYENTIGQIPFMKGSAQGMRAGIDSWKAGLKTELESMAKEWTSMSTAPSTKLFPTGKLDLSKVKPIGAEDELSYFEKKMKYMDHQVALGRMNIAEQIKYLESLDKTKLKEEELWQVEEELFSLRQQQIDQMKEYQDSWSNTIQDMIKSGDFWGAAWQKTCDQALDNFIDFLVQSAMQKEAFSGLFDLFGGLFGLGSSPAIAGAGMGAGEGGAIVPVAARGWIVPAFGGGGLPSSFKSDRILSALSPKEMVLPPDLSQGLQNLIKNGGGDTYIVNNNIQAIEPQTFQSFLARPENSNIIMGHNSVNVKKTGKAWR